MPERERFDPLEFLRSEWETQGELADRGLEKLGREGNEYIDCLSFPDGIQVTTRKRELVGPATEFRIGAGERSFDVLSLVPDRYSIEVSNYPSGSINHRSGRIRTPMLRTKGALLSTLHEIGHAWYRRALDPESVQTLENARQQPEGEHTESQREVILTEERYAWGYAVQQVEKISETLGVPLIRDRELMESYVKKRVETYEMHL